MALVRENYGPRRAPPPPISTSIDTDSQQTSTSSTTVSPNSPNTEDYITSPILRDFDRYPVANGRSTESTLNDSVTKIMSTAAVQQQPNEMYTAKAFNNSRASLSSTTSTSDKRLTKKFQKGQIKISAPNGFQHVSGQGVQASISPSQPSWSSTNISTSSPSPTTTTTGTTATSFDSASTPPVPPPPTSQGPPVKSYRESMALRSGVVLEPSTSKESRFSKALGTHHNNNIRRTSTSSSTASLPQQPQQQHPHHPQQQQQQQQQQSSRESKRISRLPWKRASEKPPPMPSLPNISEPVLEYSTSELIHEQRFSKQSIPLSEYYPNGPPGHNDAYVQPQPQPQPQHQHQHQPQYQNRHTPASSRSSSVTMQNTNVPYNTNYTTPDGYTHTRNFSQRSMTSSSNGDAHTTTSPSTLPTPTSPMNTSVAPVLGQPLPPQFPPSPMDMEIAKWRQKCREADDKRRELMMDYQQKLDAERKKNMELESKLESMIREKAAAAANAVSLATAPMSRDSQSKEMSQKIKSLESQRKALKEALQTVRENKDLEIAEYKSMVIKLRKRPVANNNSETPPSSGTSSPAPNRSNTKQLQQEHDMFEPARIGISPLLPMGNPYEVGSYKRN